MRLFSLLVSAVAVTVLFCAPAHAAQGGSVDQNNRYDSFMMDGALHRFDRVIGTLQKLSKLPNGALQWVPVEVQVGDGAPAQQEVRIPPPQQKVDNAGPAVPPGQPGRRAPTIEIEDDQGNVITDSISPDDRKAAIPLISSYENKVSLSHTVQIGDKITGNILIKNIGDRRLKQLELTMYVPIIGRDKPEEHHFLFLDKPGSTTPPQPGSGGRDPLALLQKVDIPCPSGGVKGSPELKISFIRFE